MALDKTTVSSYTWGALAAAVIVLLGSIWLAAGPAPSEPRGAAYAEPQYTPRPAPVYRQPAPAYPSVQRFAYASSPQLPRVRVVPLVPRSVPAEKLTPRQTLAEEVREMFPVGNINKDAPQVAHPYRDMPELFPSFQYQDRMWSHTGTFATADQVLLASIGGNVDGKEIFALGNTVAPWDVLFVQSSEDPVAFAIYR